MKRRTADSSVSRQRYPGPSKRRQAQGETQETLQDLVMLSSGEISGIDMKTITRSWTWMYAAGYIRLIEVP